MMEDVRGRQVNITQGLELHKNLLTPGEQGVLVNQIEQWVAQGHRVISLSIQSTSVRLLVQAWLGCKFHLMPGKAFSLCYNKPKAM